MVLTPVFANVNDLGVIGPFTFLNSAGVTTDPTSVTITVTDPLGNQVTYTYPTSANLIKVSTGVYQLNLAPSVTDGLWSFVWVGTGNGVQEVEPGTLRILPVTQGQMYAGVEELKDRLGITDVNTDFQCQVAMQTASRWVERHCGRFFYQQQATRTYVPYSIYELPVDDLLSVTQLAVDYNGFGVFDTIWNSSQFQLAIYDDDFVPAVFGESRPYTLIRVTQTGQFFPFVWPFSRLDRVQINGLWGWPAVPAAVMHATVLIASELFKLKDTPFGLAGNAEYGIVQVHTPNSPLALELLAPYRNPRRKVGM